MHRDEMYTKGVFEEKWETIRLPCDHCMGEVIITRLVPPFVIRDGMVIQRDSHTEPRCYEWDTRHAGEML